MADYITWIRSKVGHDPVILVGVCVVVSDDENKILLQRRSDNKAWCLPGGHMEIGETAQSTVEREFFEEMGTKLTVKDFVGVYTNRNIMTYPNGDKSYPIGIFFTGIVKSKITIGEEVLQFEYFSQQNLPNYILEAHTEPISDYFAGKRGVIR